MRLVLALRVRNTKNRIPLNKDRATRRFNRGSKQKLGSCLLQIWSNIEATPNISACV